MNKSKKPISLKSLISWIIGGYLILFIINYFSKPSEVFLTNKIYISTKEDIWLWTFIQVITLVILVVVFILTLKLCFKALISPRRFIYFGSFFILLGGGGVMAILLTAPKDVLQKNIHVPVIGAVIAAIGILMIIKGRLK